MEKRIAIQIVITDDDITVETQQHSPKRMVPLTQLAEDMNKAFANMVKAKRKCEFVDSDSDEKGSEAVAIQRPKKRTKLIIKHVNTKKDEDEPIFIKRVNRKMPTTRKGRYKELEFVTCSHK